jgi:hypothetical protein
VLLVTGTPSKPRKNLIMRVKRWVGSLPLLSALLSQAVLELENTFRSGILGWSKTGPRCRAGRETHGRQFRECEEDRVRKTREGRTREWLVAI